MDRGIIYPGQIPLETDLLFAQKASMIGLSKLAAAMLGTSTVVNGLSVVPNSPAALNVLVNPGEIYALANIDGTAYSSIAADTTHQILKQGISLDQVTLACAAPGTAGFSINYLIQATFSEVDGTPVALPYYNASNPSQAYSGPANSGTAQNTRRSGTVVLSAKPGTAATTGTQTTPAPDAGYVGLAVVTVANGQATITSGNITVYSTLAAAPSSGLLVGGMQNSAPITSAAGGTADALTAAYSPAIASLVNGMTLYVRAAAANATTTPTFTPANGVITAKTIVKGAGAALVAGDIAGGGHWIELQYDLTLDKWVLQNPAAGVGVTPAQFDNSTKNATTAFAQAIGLKSAGYTAVNATTALTAANIGQTISVYAIAGGPYTLTTPPSATVPVGSRLHVLNDGTIAWTVLPNGADTFRANYTYSGITTLTVNSGDWVEFEYRGGGSWEMVAGTVLDKYTAAYAASLSASGYQKLPSGLIVQWGSITSSASAGAAVAVTFPIAFPSANYSITATAALANTTQTSVWEDGFTTTGVNLRCNATSTYVSWMAVGK